MIAESVASLMDSYLLPRFSSFHRLEKSLKRSFNELKDQEKVLEDKIAKSRVMLQKREAAVLAKEHNSLERLRRGEEAKKGLVWIHAFILTNTEISIRVYISSEQVLTNYKSVSK